MEDLRIKIPAPVPYLPSTEWTVGRIFRENASAEGRIFNENALMEGRIFNENALRAPKASHKLSSRDYTRTLIASNSPEGMVLTVPIKGGRGRVKHGDILNFRMSSHGDWRRIHLGALRAAYEREPFFSHLFWDLDEEYEDRYGEVGDNFSLFTSLLWGVMENFIRLDETLPEILNASESDKARFASLRDRMLAQIDPSHSFLEPLFRFGPDAVFLLA